MKRLYDILSGCKKEEDEASFVDTKDYSKFYSSKSDRYRFTRLEARLADFPMGRRDPRRSGYASPLSVAEADLAQPLRRAR